MEIKLFGKSLFSFKSDKSGPLFEMAEVANKESKYLPDFYLGGNNEIEFAYTMVEMTPSASIAVPGKKKETEKPKEEKKKLNPRGVYNLKLLNDENFKINTNVDYIEKTLEAFRDKLNLISAEEYDMRRGVAEISSVIMRMENRKKYTSVRTFFEEFPYTTSSKINTLLKNKDHDNLKIGQIAQFVADMPKEATDIMKNYDQKCVNVCGKKAVFYIIADKKDFQKSNTRRDPILLVQSPFGHFWQILGAWDKEMLFLEEL